MAITENQLRNQLGRFILISNLGFGALIVLYYLARGFDDEEFVELLKILVPIKSAYLTALTRFVITNKNVISGEEDTSPKVNSLFASTSFIIIVVHISSLIIAVSLYALFNSMEFESLKNIILGLETFFGVYVGLIIASMFKIDSEQ
jgi:hypothetical protein